MLDGKWARDTYYYETRKIYLKNSLEFNGTQLIASNFLYEDEECKILLYTEINEFESTELLSQNTDSLKAGTLVNMIKKSCKVTPFSDKGVAKLKEFWGTLNWEIGVEKTVHPMAHIKLVEKDIAEIIASRFKQGNNLFFDDVKYIKV